MNNDNDNSQEKELPEEKETKSSSNKKNNENIPIPDSVSTESTQVPVDTRKTKITSNTGYADISQEKDVPLITGNPIDIKNIDSNFVFFFGISGSGKTVILSAILYYYGTQAGALGPKLDTQNTKPAKALLYEWFTKLKKGMLPDRSPLNQLTRLDFVFKPNNKSKKVTPINLTFLETAGGNHSDISRGGNYINSIDAYLSSNIPLQVIIVTSFDTAEGDDVLINEFFDLLETKGKNLNSVNLILVISKWDISGRTGVSHEEELEDFIQLKLPITNKRVNTFELNKTYFTIGNVISTANGERIEEVNLASAELLSKWLYQNISGVPLDYEGTFLERIKFSLFP